jgi:3'-phosphoadenosine 5'-phosphosulfate sulfotransferase (PAPS reductase)/FAD synthetase
VSNPYLIAGPALISFSGGRTSAYMLKQMLDACGGAFAPDVHVCFANTGKEREETLRFVHECQARWGVPIHWIEWRSRRKSVPVAERFEEVGYNSASRAGEPFAALIADKKSTPKSVARWCTENLKVLTIQAFMEARGHTAYANVVGLRADEPLRVIKGRMRGSIMPLADAGITKRDVMAFWAAQPFDLGLLPFEGNCDGCFLKARPKLWEIERTAPGTLQWWSDMETGPGKGRFVTEYSYAELIRDVRRQPDMFAGGLFDNDPDMDAECGLWCAGEAA